MSVSTPDVPPFWLRLGRTTRYLPRFRGLTSLLKVYRKVIHSDRLFRIDDFDGTLKLDLSVRETIGVNLWHAPNAFEKPERKLFCSEITNGTVVLDVGANIGIYTLLAARRGARVFAIEPDPGNIAMLRHHVELNGFADRVTIFEVAATDRPQPLKLYRNSANWGGSTLFGAGEAVVVEGRTIDSLNLPPIDVCKMDIEGSEAFALRGMSDTLARSPRMKLLIECSPAHSDVRPMLALLQAEFKSICIVDGPDLVAPECPERFCNLWAHH